MGFSDPLRVTLCPVEYSLLNIGSMKQMTCVELGGACSKMLSGETADQLLNQGYEHVLQNHPEVVQQVMRMSDAERNAWDLDFQAKWNQASDLV